MIGRFSLYGFLKNQQYYEPFFLLALLAKGLSFFEYGLLIAFREIAINLLEIPSGALADVYGRRRCMILSFCSYIISFLIFGFGVALWQLCFAMFFFAVGEAFRTGTHKAMIFTWLRLQGRTDERTKIYMQALQLFHDEVPAICVAHSTVIWPTRNNVMNFKLHPTGSVRMKNVKLQ